MSVAPETLDTIMCEWCPDSTPATAITEYWLSGLREWSTLTNLCKTHANEAATDFTAVNLYPLDNKPEYTTLETIASPMTGEWTIKQLEQAARYGAPYPVCGDLTTKRRNKMMLKMSINAEFAKTQKSWVGHDPNGEQY